jgi:hypothetical protein
MNWAGTGAQTEGCCQRIGAATVVVYAGSAIVFGIGLFIFACMLPAALALAGGQLLEWALPKLRILWAEPWCEYSV